MLHYPVDGGESSAAWEIGFPAATRNWHWLCGFFAPDADGKTQFHAFQVPRAQQEHEDAVTPLWSSGTLTTEDNSPVRNVPIMFWPTRNTPILNETLFAIGRGEEERASFCLFALHAWTGDVLWSYRLPESEPPTVGTLVATEGLVYIQSEEKVEAIDTSTHLPLWNWQAPSPLLHAILADGFLYAFAEQGQIIALDAYQGERCWTWTMEGEMLRQWQACDQDTKRRQASFSTIADETLYVVVGDTLYALR